MAIDLSNLENLSESSRTEDSEQASQKSKSFDPSALRLTQNYAALAATKKIITQVPLRKPDKQWFFRVHPDPGWTFEAAILEVKEDRNESYVVAPELYSELSLEVARKALYTAINRQKVIFLWPVKLRGEDDCIDSWNQSALEAAERAKQRWIRLVANMGLGGYDLYEAQGELPEPEWPDASFDQILKIAFKGRVINSPDHPALKRLRGEM